MVSGRALFRKVHKPMRLYRLRTYTMLVAAGMFLGGSPLHALANAEKGIEISGKADPDNPTRSFIWTITNTDRKPIMSFEVPAYLGGGLVVPPKGWEVTRESGAKFGRRAKWEQLTFKVTSSAFGIRRGQSVEFHVRVHANLHWEATPEKVVLGFRDDEEITLAGVWCPSPENAIRQFFPAIGLGTMFAIYLLVKLFRKGGKKSTEMEA